MPTFSKLFNCFRSLEQIFEVICNVYIVPYFPPTDLMFPLHIPPSFTVLHESCGPFQRKENNLSLSVGICLRRRRSQHSVAYLPLRWEKSEGLIIFPLKPPWFEGPGVKWSCMFSYPLKEQRKEADMVSKCTSVCKQSQTILRPLTDDWRLNDLVSDFRYRKRKVVKGIAKSQLLLSGRFFWTPSPVMLV